MGVIEQFPGIPPAAASRLAGKLLNRHSPHEIAEAIEVLLDLLDCLGGDPDAEGSTWPNDPIAMADSHLPDDDEAIGDEADVAWVEWSSRPPLRRRYALDETVAGHEDDETVGSEDDFIAHASDGPGCPISDPDLAIDDNACDGDDGILHRSLGNEAMKPAALA